MNSIGLYTFKFETQQILIQLDEKGLFIFVIVRERLPFEGSTTIMDTVKLVIPYEKKIFETLSYYSTNFIKFWISKSENGTIEMGVDEDIC